MFKNVKFLFAFLLVGGFSSQTLMAQDALTDAHDVTINVPDVAILDIEPSAATALTLAPIAPVEAGAALDFSTATDNSLWLNYSSIIGSAATRKVSVAITTGTVPGGTLLKLAAGGDAGNGEGTVGTPGGVLTLSSASQDLVTGIGSCYTNTPQNNGHQLTYSLELNGGNYADLDFDDAGLLVITYTISDE